MKRLIQTDWTTLIQDVEGDRNNVSSIDDEQLKEFLKKWELISEERQERALVGVYRKKRVSK